MPKSPEGYELQQGKVKKVENKEEPSMYTMQFPEWERSGRNTPADEKFSVNDDALAIDRARSSGAESLRTADGRIVWVRSEEIATEKNRRHKEINEAINSLSDAVQGRGDVAKAVADCRELKSRGTAIPYLISRMVWVKDWCEKNAPDLLKNK